MKVKVRFILLILIYFTGYSDLFSQITTFNGQQNGLLELSFLKEQIEAKAQSTIFNIVKIKNNSARPFSGKINLSVPRDWSIIGDNTYDIHIQENDSLNLPVRISISRNALGDIGYSIVASVTDLGAKTVKSAYSFVTIPRVTDFSTKSMTRFNYISKDQDKINFEYLLKNEGNVNELVHMEVLSSSNISVEGSDEYFPYIAEYSLAPNSDTVINLEVSKNKLVDETSYSSIKIATSSADTTYNKVFWLKMLDNSYIYAVPEYYKCAILELFAHNILSSTSPTYSMLLKGRVLFKNDNDIYYYFRNYNIDRSVNTSTSLGKYYKAYIGYENKYVDFRVGSIERSIEQNMYGNGVNLKLKLKKNQLEAIYLRDVFERYYSGGGKLEFNLLKFRLNAGGVYTDIFANSIQTKLAFGGIGFSFLKHSNINFTGGISQIEQSSVTTDLIGYGFNVNYNLNFKKLKFDIKANYGEPNYIGIYGGRFLISSGLKYKMSNTSAIQAKYIKHDNLGRYDILNNITYNFKRSYDYWQVDYSKTINNFLSYQIGPLAKLESTDQFSASGQIFQSFDAKLFLSANILTKFSKIQIVPRITAGTVQINFEEANNVPEERSLFSTFDFTINIFKKNTGLYTAFRYGPSNINENYVYFINDYFAKWFYIMPYYSQYVFDKKMKIDIRANYINNISANENSFNLNNQFSWFLPRDFTIYFLNTFSTRTRIDRSSNTRFSYNSIYFEVGLRKEFNCNQPRIQYHNLTVIFFRDLNGDRVKDKNEPGISNIYANIIRDFESESSIANNEFVEAELMSDQFGIVEYKNISNGDYTIKYKLFGAITGSYSLEELETNFTMDEDKTIYIPYLENNRIIGKVIMNRDPLSSLGNIDISNIRVIAEDTKGHTYSALTDKQGDFTLYTPVTDHYILKINNIFYESFDLQQSEFIVKFNGYKQFEVTFIFNEKKKKINFDNELDVEDIKLDDIKVIRKTTLSGKIRDAISLEPVEAEIKIINNKSNKVISRAVSNRLNGNYSISYAAGTHFRIEVISKEHWEHVENLYIEQVISIQSINKDIMLNKLSESRDEQKTFIIYDKEEEFKENFKRGQQIPINYLTFDLKQTRLDTKAKPELDRLIDLLNKNKSVKIEVGGHADDGGNSRVENIMAKRRAEAVKKYLINHGLDKNRISVKSYSNSRPLIPGTSEKARSKNRRVEIIVQ